MDQPMNYEETLRFLFNSLPMYQRTGKAAYKANLDNTMALDSLLGHPHRKFRTIHVAGTNGKGSVSHMLASVLQESGYKTGLYTSPHLIDFRERIRVNGGMIPEQQVVQFVRKIRKEIEQIAPSFFEMTVAMAFDHFASERTDVAVIETGMGGRLDSTNIILPEVSVITRIAMDHMQFLGNTEELIAGEKAGIIKENVPIVAGINSETVDEVFAVTARQRNASIHFAGRERTFLFQTFTDDLHALFHFRNQKNLQTEVIATDLPGTYQHENISVVLSVIETLREKGWSIPGTAVEAGLQKVKQNTSLRGRWEVLGANPRIICDTAHNASGIAAVMQQLQQIPTRSLHIVWGMVEDKPVEELLHLLPKEAIYYFTQPSIPRALSGRILMEKADHRGLKGKIYAGVDQAFKQATLSAGPDDTIFVGGSTFIVADLLAALENK